MIHKKKKRNAWEQRDNDRISHRGSQGNSKASEMRVADLTDNVTDVKIRVHDIIAGATSRIVGFELTWY